MVAAYPNHCTCTVMDAGLATYDRATGMHRCNRCHLVRIVARPALVSVPTIAQEQAAQAANEARALVERSQGNAREFVAGAIAVGHGSLLSWEGHGKLSLGKLVTLATDCGVSTKLLPECKSPRAFLGKAIATYTTSSVRSVCEERKDHGATYSLARMLKAGEIGDSAGTRFARITLSATGDVTTEGQTDDPTVVAIVAEYKRLVAESELAAGEVTEWLESYLIKAHRAVRVGRNWYVKRGSVASAQRLLESIKSAGWGRYWITSLPCATTADLCAGILEGLQRDLDVVLARLEAQRVVARNAKKTDVGQRAAQSIARDVTEIAERGLAYGALFGEALVAPLRNQCKEALRSLESVIDDTVTRFDLIYDELEIKAGATPTDDSPGLALDLD